MRFSTSFTVNSHLCDRNGVLRPSAAMTLLQETANLQLNAYHSSYDEMQAEGRAFFLSSMAIRFYAPLHAYETVTGETWGVGGNGYRFPRYHCLRQEERTLCEAVSIWALIDLSTRRPLRTDAYHPQFTYEEMPPFAAPVRHSLPREGMEQVGTHRVAYPDIDRNQHMNNTAYADMLCSFIDMRGKWATSLFLSYLSEAPAGEYLSIFHCCTEDGTHLFRTVRADGKTNIEAALTLADLS